MKNNLILGLQGFTKILTGAIFVLALIATNFTYTYIQGGAAGSRGSTTQPSSKRRRTVVAPRTSARTKPTSSILTPSAPPLETLDPQLIQAKFNRYLDQPVPWNSDLHAQYNRDLHLFTPEQQNTMRQNYANKEKVNWYLQQQVPWSAQVHANYSIDSPSFSEAQRNQILWNYNIKLQQQSQSGVNPFLPAAPAPVQTQQQTNPFISTPAAPTAAPLPFAAPKKEITKAKDQGILSTLWDYQSSLAKLIMPGKDLTKGQTVVATVAGTAAGIYMGPTMLGYLGLMGALKLGGSVLLFDRIADVYQTGGYASRREAIEATKNGLEQFIIDSGAYPTYNSQIEGLGNPNEFAITARLDEDIVSQARTELIDKIRAERDELLRTNSEERKRQDAIDQAINNLRTSNFRGDHKQYAEVLKNMPSAECQAYISELTRAKTHVAVMDGKEKEAQAKEKAAAGEPASEPAQQESSSVWRVLTGRRG